MDRLEDCYNKIHEQVRQDIEPFESVALVDKYRWYWKPNKTQIILLAESHIFTSDDERSIEIPKLDALPYYPGHYAKFVYCLGYGERELTKNLRHPLRDGTPQFWKILYSCNNPINSNLDFKPILKLTNYKERLSNKIGLLLSLRQKGVWLIDASIMGLYDHGEKSKRMKEIIQISWSNYIKHVIQEADPRYLVCIGKGVHSILQVELDKLFGNRYRVIPQPQARLKSGEQMLNWMNYYNICKRYAGD